MLCEKNLSRAGDPLLLARQDGPRRLFLAFSALHFDEGQMIASLRDEIDFAAFCFIALRKNTVALPFKELLRAAFGSKTYLIRALACVSLRLSWRSWLFALHLQR